MTSELSAQNLSYIIDAIYSLNKIDKMEDYGARVLSCIRTIIPCRQSTFFLLTNDGGISRPMDSVIMGAPAHYLELFMSGRYDDDKYFAGFYINPSTHTFRDRDVVPESIRANSRLYREIYEREGLIYALRAVLNHNDALIGEVALFNSAEEGEFSDQQLQVLDRLAPHIALKLAQLTADSNEKDAAKVDKALVSRFDLTLREAEVIQLVRQNMTNVEIADVLFVSLSTVKKHINSAYRKMGISSRRQIESAVGLYSSKN